MGRTKKREPFGSFFSKLDFGFDFGDFFLKGVIDNLDDAVNYGRVESAELAVVGGVAEHELNTETIGAEFKSLQVAFGLVELSELFDQEREVLNALDLLLEGKLRSFGSIGCFYYLHGSGCGFLLNLGSGFFSCIVAAHVVTPMPLGFILVSGTPLNLNYAALTIELPRIRAISKEKGYRRQETGCEERGLAPLTVPWSD